MKRVSVLLGLAVLLAGLLAWRLASAPRPAALGPPRLPTAPTALAARQAKPAVPDALRVLVVDGAGQSVAGAEVSCAPCAAVPEAVRQVPLAIARTDPDGRAAFPRDPARAAIVTVRGPDGALSVVTTVTPWCDSVSIVLEDRSTLSGTARTVEGQIVARARVTARSVSAPAGRQQVLVSEATADGEGRYVLPVPMSLRSVALTARAEGLFGRTLAEDPPATEGALLGLDVTLHPTLSLEILLRRDGEPFPADFASVFLGSEFTTSALAEGGRILLTGVPPPEDARDRKRTVRVVVEPGGHIGLAPIDMRLPPEKTPPVAIDLFPAAPLRGAIRDGDGRPAEGLAVTYAAGGGTILETTTDEHGAFEFPLTPELMVAGHVRVDLPGVQRGVFDGAASRFQSEPILELPGVLSAAGRCVRSDGSPVPGARIYRGASPEQPHAWDEPAATADGDGRFVLHTTSYEDYEDNRSFVAVADGAAPCVAKWNEDGMEFVLAEGFTVAGVVVDENGEPQPFAGVTLHATDGKPWQKGHSASIQTSMTADARGRYRFVDVAPGLSWAVTASDTGDADGEARTVTPENALDLRLRLLPRAFFLAGRVAFEDGSPSAGVRVSAAVPSGDGKTWSCAPTGPDGCYSLRLAAEGPIELWVTCPKESGTGEGGIRILDRDVGATGRADVPNPIVVRPAPVVAGMVRSSDGHPVVGAEVSVEGRHTGLRGAHRNLPIGPDHYGCLTDGEGRFRIGLWPEGNCPARITAAGFEALETTLAPGGLAEIVLRPAVSEIVGTVRDGRGRAVPGIHLDLFPSRDGGEGRARSFHARTDVTGRFRVPVPSGTRVLIGLDDSIWVAEELTVTSPADVEIVVAPR